MVLSMCVNTGYFIVLFKHSDAILKITGEEEDVCCCLLIFNSYIAFRSITNNI